MGEQMFAQVLQKSVNDVVSRQYEIGIDWVNDGEYGHAMTESLDFGSWWSYSFSRFGGIELTDEPSELAPPAPGSKITLVDFEDRRDWQDFSDVYADPSSAVLPHSWKRNADDGGSIAPVLPVITGPLTYTGAEAVRQDIDGLVTALDANGIDRRDGFIAAVSPGSAARLHNAYYANDEEAVQACAQVLREEYLAITQAGLTVQIDDPSLAESWDQINPAPSVEDYRRYIQVRCDAINTALEGIDPAQVRLHLCWGSWHGPHTRHPVAGDRRQCAHRQCEIPVVRGGQCPSRARVDGVGRGGPAQGPCADTRSRGAFDQCRRTPRARCPADRPVRADRRRRPGHCLHRLRSRRSDPPVPGLGQVEFLGTGGASGRLRPDHRTRPENPCDDRHRCRGSEPSSPEVIPRGVGGSAPRHGRRR